MATNPCRTKELDIALDAARIAWERYVLARVKITQLLEAMRGDHAGEDLRWAAELGAVTEFAGQLFDALEQGPKVGGLLGSLGKAVSMIADHYADEAAAEAKQRERLAQLMTLLKELELAVRDFVNRREAARALFEAYWTCTGRLRPRGLELWVETEGTMRGALATAVMQRTWAAQLTLEPKTPDRKETYYARFARWLADPTLQEELTGEGRVTSAMPKYQWTAAKPGVSVKAAKPAFSGGPLQLKGMVLWYRSDPARASVAVRSSGEQTVTLQVTATVQGRTNRMGGDQALHDLLKQQLLLHGIGGKTVAAQWVPAQRRFEFDDRKQSAAGHTHCRVVLRAPGT